ncbi:hypothetical protein Tsp_11251 [Trichinella spiralis]|uniref:hypothetical protein n=1 Tax=Trichinella spiralis TaxID=6334 RepID=UPI0001EFEB3F|nr:hypothetical protein Tsp_11251 [Trichinella spiralis]
MIAKIFSNQLTRRGQLVYLAAQILHVLIDFHDSCASACYQSSHCAFIVMVVVVVVVAAAHCRLLTSLINSLTLILLYSLLFPFYWCTVVNIVVVISKIRNYAFIVLAEYLNSWEMFKIIVLLFCDRKQVPFST